MDALRVPQTGRLRAGSGVHRWPGFVLEWLRSADPFADRWGPSSGVRHGLSLQAIKRHLLRHMARSCDRKTTDPINQAHQKTDSRTDCSSASAAIRASRGAAPFNPLSNLLKDLKPPGMTPESSKKMAAPTEAARVPPPTKLMTVFTETSASLSTSAESSALSDTQIDLPSES